MHSVAAALLQLVLALEVLAAVPAGFQSQAVVALALGALPSERLTRCAHRVVSGIPRAHLQLLTTQHRALRTAPEIAARVAEQWDADRRLFI